MSLSLFCVRCATPHVGNSHQKAMIAGNDVDEEDGCRDSALETTPQRLW